MINDMTAQELNTYIDKVLGNSLRCLLPSYWWKRILTLIVGYVESVDGRVTTVNTSLSDVTIDVSKVINIIKKTSYVTITTSSEGSAKVYADGKAIDIPAGETVKVFCGDSFHAISPTDGGSSDNLETILSIDTSMMKTCWYTSMERMFMWCEKVSSLDVSNFDTSNVKDMSRMFEGCMSLTSLDVSNFDTSNVTNIYGMFYRCWSLTSLDVSNFDTSNVKYMDSMFEDCKSLTSLDVSNFDTSEVTDMGRMFSYCDSLTSLDVSNFDTSKVKDMSRMFSYCDSLTSLDVSSFDTSKVTDIVSMFKNCSNIAKLSLGEGFFKTRQGTEIDFSDLGKWEESSFIQSIVTNSYDRTANGLPNITINLHANTYAYLTDEHKASLTAKGYNVASV